MSSTTDGTALQGGRVGWHEQTVELQRARLLEATQEIVAANGLTGVTIEAVTKQARVSPVTFKELFGSIEQAFAALVEQVTMRSVDLIRSAFEGEASWVAGVLAGLEALLTFLDSEPSFARVCLIESLAGSPVALQERAQLLEPLATLIDGARVMLPIDRQPSAVTAEAVIASVAGVLHKRLVTRRAPPFIDLLGELSTLVVAPYLGPVEATAIAGIGDERSKIITEERVARPPELCAPVPRQVLHANATRVRACLHYVSEHPGASNKEIAEGIGVSHQGQVSGLLARLESGDMLMKRSGGPGRTNAWTLSSHGESVLRKLSGR